MYTADDVKRQLNLLLDNANSVTGNNDETLTDAISSLIAGFGASGGDENDYPFYSGQYDITPNNTDQILQTQDHILKSNIKINKISYSSVSNTSGGKTIIIG